MRLKEKQTFLRMGFPFLTNQIFQRFVDLAGGGTEVSAREAYDPNPSFPIEWWQLRKRHNRTLFGTLMTMAYCI